MTNRPILYWWSLEANFFLCEGGRSVADAKGKQQTRKREFQTFCTAVTVGVALSPVCIYGASCLFFFFFHSFGIRIKRSFPANPIAIAKKKTTAVLLLLLLFPFFFLQSPLNFWNERKVLKPVGVGSRGTLQGHWKKLTRHCLWITFYFNVKWTFGGYWTRREKDRSILEGQKKKSCC